MAATEREWAALAAAVGNRLVRAGDPRYDALRRPALPRYADVRPRAVVLAQQEGDIAAAVRFARRTGLSVTARSGGHCFAGRSSSGELIIDLRRMTAVRVRPGLVDVQPGVRLGLLEQTLAASRVGLPLGCGASVGVAGLTLGGGLGLLGRRHGLTCDHLVRARVVLPDGCVAECDDTRDAELLWALRGAGRRMGVVTRLQFRPVPQPTMTVFALTWPPERAAAVVETWQQSAPAAADAMTSELRLSSTGPGGLTAQVYGAILADRAGAAPLLEDFVGEVGAPPATRSLHCHPYLEAKQGLDQLRGPHGRPDHALGHDHDHEYSRSEFFRQPLPSLAIDDLLTGLTAVVEAEASERASGVTRQITFTAWAGAYNRVPDGDTAFVHRNEMFLVEHVARTAPTARPAEVAAARDWLNQSYAALRPWGSGAVYPNFPDPDLDDEDRAYYGRNLRRLRQVERAYHQEET